MTEIVFFIFLFLLHFHKTANVWTHLCAFGSGDQMQDLRVSLGPGEAMQSQLL